MGISRMSATRFVLAACCAAAALAGCATRAATTAGEAITPGPSGPPTLAMVTYASGLVDASLDRSARRGLALARRRLGATVTVMEAGAASDGETDLAALAKRGMRMIYAVGYPMRDDLAVVARRYPKQRFAMIGAVVGAPNVVSVTFEQRDGSFLAGALAGLVTRTGTVGFLGGMDLPFIRRHEVGFAAGARQTNPAVRVLVRYAGSFDDALAGKALARELFDRGADIVYAAAGTTGLGAIEEVERRPAGQYVISADADEDALAPGKVLTSMVDHADVAVFTVAREVSEGRYPAGHMVLGVAERGVGLARTPYLDALLSTRDAAKLKAIERAMAAGEITPPSTRAELSAFAPVSVK